MAANTGACEWSHRNQLQLVRNVTHSLPSPRFICILPRVLTQHQSTCTINACLNCLETRIRKFLAMVRGEEFDTRLSIQHVVDALGSMPLGVVTVLSWLISHSVATVQTYHSLKDLDETTPLYGILPGGFHIFWHPRKVEEQSLMAKELQEVGPIIIVIPISAKYMGCMMGGDIYFANGEQLKDAGKNDLCHAVLATGLGRRADGVYYWEFQDSNGRNFGPHSGFGRVAVQVVMAAYSIRLTRTPF